jgi:hypothetical protein
MNNFNLFDIFKNQGELSTLLAYQSVERETDPLEHTRTKDFLNPTPIKAIVTQIGFSALKWKYWGQVPSGSIQIICDKKYYNLLTIADKIIYEENEYCTYKDDEKSFMILKRTDYIVAILERK